MQQLRGHPAAPVGTAACRIPTRMAQTLKKPTGSQDNILAINHLYSRGLPRHTRMAPPPPIAASPPAWPRRRIGLPGGLLLRRRRYIFVSRGLVPRSGSYPRSRRHHHPFHGGDLCGHPAPTFLHMLFYGPTLTSYPLPLTPYLLPLTSYLLPLTSYLLPLTHIRDRSAGLIWSKNSNAATLTSNCII